MNNGLLLACVSASGESTNPYILTHEASSLQLNETNFFETHDYILRVERSSYFTAKIFMNWVQEVLCSFREVSKKKISFKEKKSMPSR